jgi:hypothetical protein
MKVLKKFHVYEETHVRNESNAKSTLMFAS